MEQPHKTTGALFVRNYGRPEKRLSDSDKARLRVWSLVKTIGDPVLNRFRQEFEYEVGVEVQWGSFGNDFKRFFKDASTESFLSAVTLVFNLSGNRPKVLTELRRIFEEEALHYSIDNLGGVHYLVDDQFDQTMRATLEALQASKFGAAKHAFETAMAKLAAAQPSGKEVIRDIFESAEAAFLTIVNDPKVNQLNKANAENCLKPVLQQRYKDSPNAEEHVSRVTRMIAEWAHVAHLFRHGIGSEEPHEAPMDYAVLMAQNGAAIIRYMIG